MRRIQIAKMISEKIEQETYDQISVPTFYVDRILKKFMQHIVDQVSKGETVELRKFGVFTPVVRKKKIGRNPMVPKVSIIIPEHMCMKFHPSIFVKKNLNKK
jgi:nucleoid DNA-binding protein